MPFSKKVLDNCIYCIYTVHMYYIQIVLGKASHSTERLQTAVEYGGGDK